MADDQLNARAQDALKTMFADLEGINVDELKSNGITIRSGDKLIKLEVALEEPITIEEEIREEFRLQLRGKLQEIKQRLNVKITEMVEMTSRVRMEAERRESDLKTQLRNSQPMPEINWNDAKRGISVVKGNGRGELIWLVRGVYAPKFVDQKPIEPKYAKKLLTNIVFLIRTSGQKVTEVSTRQIHGLEYFSHYHQQRPDCWGNWRYPKDWKTAHDILKIARDAEAVLENVNTGSIANSTPRGLPRRRTLESHIVTPAAAAKKTRKTGPTAADTVQTRTGVGTVETTGDVWTT
jgi:hypothetical protein